MTEIINQKKQKITNVEGNILAIDVSTRNYHVAVCPNNSSIIYEISGKECELEDFFTLTEKILDKTRIKLENIKSIICSRGPSSFTGVRKKSYCFKCVKLWRKVQPLHYIPTSSPIV